MVLVLPLFSKAPEITFDQGQGFPSHFLLGLTPVLLDSIKAAQLCACDNNFKQIGISCELKAKAVDVSKDYFDTPIKFESQTFNALSGSSCDTGTLLHLLNADIDNFNYLQRADTLPATLFVGKQGMWVELTCVHPSIAAHFVSAAKNISKLESFL